MLIGHARARDSNPNKAKRKNNATTVDLNLPLDHVRDASAPSSLVASRVPMPFRALLDIRSLLQKSAVDSTSGLPDRRMGCK
jgi:hypothetical protein